MYYKLKEYALFLFRKKLRCEFLESVSTGSAGEAMEGWPEGIRNLDFIRNNILMAWKTDLLSSDVWWNKV
jgi:hypothetical protein